MPDLPELFLSPHNDDEALFGSFLIQMRNPQVAVVFDAYLQKKRGAFGCDWETRRAETCRGLGVMHALPPIFVGIPDDREGLTASLIASELSAIFDPLPERIWSPLSHPRGHHQHNLVSLAAQMAFPNAKHAYYGTYTSEGKMTLATPCDEPGTVKMEVSPNADQIRNKLLALACYRSQIEIAECRAHFLRDLTEVVYARPKDL